MTLSMTFVLLFLATTGSFLLGPSLAFSGPGIAFQRQQQRRSVHCWAVLDENNNENNKRRNNDEDFSLDNIEYTGTVDWDAEWKKVAQDKDFLKNRPGSDFYKSEAEIVAIKAANTATQQVNKIASSMPSVPSWNQLKGDWKFWIGILAILSIGTSLLSASTMMPPNLPNNASPDSFYI